MAASGTFQNPVDVAVGPEGNVYVVDGGEDLVQKFTADGGFLDQWGGHGSGNGEFENPSGIAVDTAGHVYVVDSATERVQKFTAGGTFLTGWGSLGGGDGQFLSPGDISTDSGNNVYVSDGSNDRIQKFNSSGTFLTKWGSHGSGNGEFSNLNSVDVDSEDDVFASQLHGNVQKFSDGGSFLDSWDVTSPVNLVSVAVDTVGNFYVSDALHERILKLGPTGGLLMQWGSQGTGEGEFEGLAGIVATANHLYAADRGFGDGRVQKFSLNGTFIEEWPAPPSVADPVAPAPSAPVSVAGPAKPTILAGPRGKTSRRAAIFRFRSNRSGGHLECRLTGERVPKNLRAWRRCASPQRYARLGLGKKVFWVRHLRGGVSSQPARRAWRIIRGRSRATMPVVGGRVVVPRVCPRGRTCRARIFVRSGKRILAQGRYNVRRGKPRIARIRLTRVGRRTIARRGGQLGARAVAVDLRTRNRKAFPVILKVRRGKGPN